MASPTPSTASQRTIRSKCVFFPIGRCTNGDECKFSHDIQRNKSPAVAQHKREKAGGRSHRERPLNLKSPVKEHVNPPITSPKASSSSITSDHPTVVTKLPTHSKSSIRLSTNAFELLVSADDNVHSENKSQSEEVCPAHEEDFEINTSQKVADAKLVLDNSSISGSSGDNVLDTPVPEIPSSTTHDSNTETNHSFFESSDHETTISGVSDKPDNGIQWEVSTCNPRDNDALVSGTPDPDSNSSLEDSISHTIDGDTPVSGIPGLPENTARLEDSVSKPNDNDTLAENSAHSEVIDTRFDPLPTVGSSESRHIVAEALEKFDNNVGQKDSAEVDQSPVSRLSVDDAYSFNIPHEPELEDASRTDPPSTGDEEASPAETSHGHDGTGTGVTELPAEAVDDVSFYNPEVDSVEDLLNAKLSNTSPSPSSDEDNANLDYTPDDDYQGLPSYPYPIESLGEIATPHWSEHVDPYANLMIPFCRFLAQGRCTQGDACRFRHSLSINEFSLLFHDTFPPLWKFGGTNAEVGEAKKALVSSFHVCKFYPMGKCRNGQACPYLHIPSTDPLAIAPEQRPELYDEHPEEDGDSQFEQLERRNQPCKYYMDPGGCRRGDKCHFSHDAFNHGQAPEQSWESLERTRGEDLESNRQDQKAGQRSMCKWFQQGHCQWGDKCKFLHDLSSTEEVHPVESNQRRQDTEGDTGNGNMYSSQENLRWADDEDEWTRQAMPDAEKDDARLFEGTSGTGLDEYVDGWGAQDTIAEKNVRASKAGTINSALGESIDNRAAAKPDGAGLCVSVDDHRWGEHVDEWAAQATPHTDDQDHTPAHEETQTSGWGEHIDEWAAQATSHTDDQDNAPTSEEAQLSGWGEEPIDEWAAQKSSEPDIVDKGRASGGVRSFEWGEYIDEWATQATPNAAHENRTPISEGTRSSDWRESAVGRATNEASGNTGWRDRTARETTGHRRSQENGWPKRNDGGNDICQFHAQGHCRKGAQCNRSHDLPKIIHADRDLATTTLPVTSSPLSESYPNSPTPPHDGPQTAVLSNTSSPEHSASPAASADGHWVDDVPNDESVPWAVPYKPICDFFARGHCKLGDRCQLRHEEDPSRSIGNSGNKSADMEVEIETAPKPAEKKLLEEAITEDESSSATGGSITEDQPTSDEQNEQEEVSSPSPDDGEKTWEAKWSEEPAEPSIPSKIQAPCKAFGQGFCELGDDCPYQHISDLLESQEQSIISTEPSDEGMAGHVDTAQTHATEPELLEEEPELLVERELFNCTVRFGLDNGCSPTSVRSASDAFQAIVSNLPPDISFAEVVELADIVNIGTQDDDVVLEGTDAIMKFAEPLSAVKAVTKLHGQTYGSRPLTARLATETVASPLDCKAVKIAWPSPSRSAWAYYPSVAIAKVNEKRLNGTIFQGRKIKAELYRARKSDASYAVRISGLLVNVDRPAFEELAQALVVHMNAATYTDCPLNNIYATLARAARGSLESFHRLPLDPTHQKHMAFARFYTGISSVMSEHGKLCDFLGDGEALSLQKVFYANYKISQRRFQAVNVALEQLREVHKEHCQMRIYDDEEPVDIHLYADAENRIAFGKANRGLRDVLEGEVFTQEGKPTPVWDEYFDLSSSTRAIEKINNDKSFFVKVDQRRQVIYVLGDRPSRERAKGTLRKLLGMVRAQRHVLPLDLRSLRALVDGGYESMQKELGANKVLLDVAAPHLIVRGDADMKKAKTMLAASATSAETLNDISRPVNGVGDRSEPSCLCPVCRRPPREPVKLSCKHTYCTACLQYALSSLTQITPLRCLVGCEEYIQYSVMRDVLPMVSEAELLRNAFLDHVRARPDEFFFCPLPHCQTVFRPLSMERQGAPAIVYVCPGCSTKVCATCRSEYHEGWDCNAQPEADLDSFTTTTDD